MKSNFVKARTNEGDYLCRRLKNDSGIEPLSFLARTSLRLVIVRCLFFKTHFFE